MVTIECYSFKFVQSMTIDFAWDICPLDKQSSLAQFPELLKITASLLQVSWLLNSSVDYIDYDTKFLKNT